MKESPSFQRPTRLSLAATGSTWRIPSAQVGTQDLRDGYRAKSMILDSALEEYRKLRQRGESIDRDAFCSKFPEYRKSLLRLIDVAENLGDLGDVPDPFPEVGDHLLGFDILDRIGVGAIARVYLAAEPELGGRIVVIKVSGEGTAEAAILGKLQHPNIVQVYSVKNDEASGMTAVCMPYQGSATLTDVLDLTFQAGQPPTSASVILDVSSRLANMSALRDDDVAEHKPDPILQSGTFVDGVVHLGIQLADALEYAHSCGVLHRDLKPSNVLLTPSGRPMLLDFNLSFDVSGDSMPRGGTLPYMAPEQIRAGIRADSGDGAADPRSDAFSLGVILYELLTGRLPYGGPPDNIGPQAASLWQLDAHETPPQPVRSINPLVPESIAAIVERCLSTSPEARYSSLAEVAAALRTHFTARERATRWIRRHAILCSAMAATLLILLTSAAVFLALRPPLNERLYQSALTAYKEGDIKQSILILDQSLNLEPTHRKALLLRGVCYSTDGRREEAVKDLKSVIAIAPSAGAYDYLACELFLIGNGQESVKCFRKAIELAPAEPNLYAKYAGSLTLVDRNKPHVLNEIETALTLDPTKPSLYLLRGEYFQAKGLIDEAMFDYETALRLSRGEISAQLFVIDKLAVAAQKKSDLLPAIKKRVEQAIHDGVTRATLKASSFNLLLAKQPWWKALVDDAPDGNLQERFTVGEMIVPSVSIAHDL